MEKKFEIPLIAIVGATATGKSELAVLLASKINGALVNADSKQLYTDMIIGTGMPEFESFQNGIGYISGVPHYCYAVLNPAQVIDVATYQKLADAAIKKIFTQGKIPILVGGTGFYVHAIIDNIFFPESAKNISLRDKLNALSLAELQEWAHRVAPEKYKTVDIKNARRLIRVIEIKMSGIGDAVACGLSHPLFMCGLRMARSELFARIDVRVDAMIRRGLLDEARRLISLYGSTAPALDAIGYKEIARYLSGKESLDVAVAEIKERTRQYAKRQETWFKRDARIMWFNPTVQTLDSIVQDLQRKINVYA